MEDNEGTSNQLSFDDGEERASTERWTCEACGCNTNASSDQSCTICGTASGSSILRRAGYAARAGLFAREFGNRRDFMGAADAGDIADIWGRVVDGTGLGGGDDHDVMAALAMEVAGHQGGRNREATRQRLLDAARSFHLSATGRSGEFPTASSTTTNSHEDLMQAATDNASHYSPRWSSPTQITGHAIAHYGIEIGDGERQNVAHLPFGADEGRTVRAHDSIPRSLPFSAILSSGQSQERRRRRVFGFKVAFDHPDRETGSSLGGCYLVGLTTSQFRNFGERNSLQQSSLFWGIEDAGNKFEGSSFGSPTTRSSRTSAAEYGTELEPSEAPLNDHDDLFGVREVVTVIIDIESRNMTFWRDSQHLGTLVANLPPRGSMYPVAVPFNAGSTVAITGLDGDPLALLQNFNSGWKQAKLQNDEENRKRLASLRSVLIEDDNISPQAENLLRVIFSWYSASVRESSSTVQLNRVEAARLWYSCGIKLAHLEGLFEADEKKSHVVFEDFINILGRVIREDCEAGENHRKSDDPQIQIGDRVQLVEGYESKGDATAGPLQPGDRGRVVELQRGPSGQRHSVRVLFGGRRWWYQPQAVVPERGGLIESPAVWFVSRILRTHGFDHTTLESYVGNVVTSESWQFGDIVVPRKLSLEADISSADSVCGRIVPSESIYCKRPSPFATPELVGRKSKTVLVEYVNKKFSELVGLAPDLYSDESSVQLQTCRVRVSELVYSTVFHGSFVFEKTSSGLGRPKRLDWCHPASLHGIDSTSFCLSPQDVVGSNTKKDVAGIAELDVRAIESVTKECRNHPGSLASLFAVGLPGAIITAIEKTKEKAEKEEPKEQQSQVVEALGALLFCVSTTLFSSLDASSDSDKKKADIVGGSTNPTSGDADDSMEEASSIDLSGNQSNIAEEVGAANSRVLGDPSRSARLSSLQERRNVLLALMSRARRGNARGAGSLNELAERDADDMGSLRQMMPGIPLGPGAAAGPFFSGAEADIFHDRSFDEFFAMSSAENPRDERAFGGASEGDPGPPSTGSVSRIDKTNPFLWSIIRGSSAGPAKRLPARDSSGISVPAVLRSLGLNAFLTNSYEWAEALIEMQSNEKPISTQSSSLRRAYDEDETPILQVAISLGCSLPILKLLLQCGAPVGETDVQKAAYTNQPSVLALLLHHATHSHDSIDLDRCSPTVADVVKRAGIFQEELKQKMTDQSGDFVAASLCLLVQFGLLCRSNRHKSTHWTACSDTVTGTLSGHSMLRALQTQQTASGTRAHELTDTDEDHNHDADEANSTTNLCEEGLLSITPADVLAKAFLADSTCALTNLLLLIEDSLYSKAVSDGAVGLTMLMVLLQKFPFLRSSAEMQRYGFGELVAFHSTLASRRLADAVGKKGGKRPNAVEDSTLDCSKQYDGSIRCPAKHVAVLHITRHSSFRCDLCGKGVDRGRPMHGCRECDWDACFECTDSTTAHAKNAHVKFLAEKCHESLASNCSGESITGICKASVEKSLEMLSTLDNSKGLHNLSICIKQRDCAAMRELARMLEEPGQITNYQFAFSILPSLHVSLLGKGSELERSSCLGRKSVHRNKKARVVGDCGKGASDIAKYLLYRESHGKDVVMEEEPNEDENKPSDSAKESIKTGENNKSRPEIFRRLHKVLSFNETLSSGPISPKGAELGSGKGTLKSLTQPIEVQLWPSNESQTSLLSPASTPMTLKIEPLVCLEDVELHVLRTCKVAHPTYLCFCQQLAREGAIIVEQARIGRGKKWRLGKINSYDEELGCHTLNYAVAWKDSDTPLELNNTENFRNVEFTKVKTRLVLAAREYYVLGSDRATNDSSSANADIEEAESMEDVNLPSDLPFVGARVELRNVADEDERKGSQTVLAVIPQTKQCVLVSDTGIVSTCSSSQIFAESFARTRSAAERRRRERRQDRDPFSRGLPFFRTHLSELARQDGEPEQDIANQVGVMKRTWSALSLLEKRQPVEVTSRSNESTESEQYAPGRGLVLRCEQGELLIDQASIEVPPLLNVSFGAGPLSTVDISSSRSLPLVGALKQLKRLTERQCDQGNPGRGVEKLYFAINTDRVHAVLDKSICRPFTAAVPVSSKSSLFWPTSRQGSRARKARANSISEEEEPSGGLCDGLGETCVQSMEVLGLLADFSDEPLSAENKGLSQQLAESLDDPLTVVGGALPEWTTAAPMFAPKLFSYDARRLLLERSAFGVSRSALRQQEAKVNVDRLRERMASLRARAVELVGEAFSGGAEDPTALQLQADELYGMEESLSNRIKAAFRAEQWQEYALEVAKAAVERDCLLSDAEKIFERIAKADHICGRRIEVRFSKESGFDASTGSEAGVTRGFYADVAEALLSCENVSGVNCVQFCASFSKDKLQQDDFPKIPAIQCDPCKLPTFIPDTDASSQVIIPTPRSDSRSTLGVFPRPLLPQHPQFGEVLARYKFIGRLFAAAMRDSFMFPLPLSASFLKLVQRCDDSVSSLDDTVLDAKLDAKKGRRSIILTASDLPRPGFLGGEIYAVDTYICQALDRIDVEASDTPLSPQHVKRRYSEIASDKNFARVALGKHYELSFEEYFQDRTFVDPLDPTQGPEATPLCPNGYEKQVTIYNVRDYVALAKQFMLHDGVIGQAQAFRSGVDDFFPSEYLRLFTPEELQKDVCGTGDNVDTWTESDIRALLKLDGGKGVAEALVAVAAIGGEGGASLSRRFGASSPTIGHLVKALLEANPKRRRQFLSFVTSVPIVTPGKIEVVPVMSPSGEFQSMSDPSCLPRANTCARRLYLPKFENYKSFSEVLWAVVESHSKFKGFYEWRGS